MSGFFVEREPTLEDQWRGIVLFGLNVASYKFALAKALLELKPVDGQLIKLEDLAVPFAKHVAEHLKLSDKQCTSASSRFLDACRTFNSGELTQNELREQTIRLGFNNVIDAFHVIGREPIPAQFFIDERKASQGIRITTEFSKLMEGVQSASLMTEVESRWRLVETAWELGVSRSLVSIDYDPSAEALFAIDMVRRRKPVTGSRGALNGYQRGKCFYCFRDISLKVEECIPDVDHFFPHVLKQYGFGSLVDGVWNLVLSCRDCNRGVEGKSARIPSTNLLERLCKRNEYLIGSHHPLRETILKQTGPTSAQRRTFLNDWYNRAKAVLIHEWKPIAVSEEAF